MIGFGERKKFLSYAASRTSACCMAVTLSCASVPQDGHADSTAKCNTGLNTPESLECGIGAFATAEKATAIGTSAMAGGENGATALGHSSNASGDYSTALGYEGAATGQSAVSLGYNSTAAAAGAIAIGGDAGDADALGAQCTARRDGELVFGDMVDTFGMI